MIRNSLHGSSYLDKNKANPKKRRSPSVRIKESIAMNEVAYFSKSDVFESSSDEILLVFSGAVLISNNDLLRVHNITVGKYKKSWQHRVSAILKDVIVNQPYFSEPVQVEFAHFVSHGRYMDFDGIVGAFKYVLDALVKVGVVHDDSVNYVPLVVPIQFKGEPKLIVKISKSKGFEYSKSFMERCNEEN